MNKKFTNEEILEAAQHCIADGCDNCPLEGREYLAECIEIFAHHIVDTTKPAFDWDGFCRGEFAVNLRTQEEYDRFMQECENKSLIWYSETKPSRLNCWGIHTKNTCVHHTKKTNLLFDDAKCFKRRGIPIIVYPTKADEPAPTTAGTGSDLHNNVDNTTTSKDITSSANCQEVILHKVYSRLIDAYDNDIRSDLGIRYLGEALGMLEALGYGEC